MSSTAKKTAFSLLEVAIVIVIIGLLIVGVVGSKHLIAKSRLTTAISMTRSSPINSTLNNKLWLETSLAELSLGINLTTGDAITSWLDNSNNKTSITISAPSGSAGATYANTINYVQAVKFGSNSATDHLQINNASFLNNTDYTIFILEKRIATNSGDGNYLLGSPGEFALGYQSETTMIQTHGEDASDSNQANLESLSSYSNKPRAIIFTHSSTDGNKIYINGTLANEDNSSTAKTHLSGITTLAIGNNYNGEIGEIAIFDRELKTVERREIEDYLTDKWNAPNNRDSSSSCTSGTVTSSGCIASCSVNVVGSSDTTARIDGSSGNINCNVTGYTGTVAYSCSSGEEITGTCSCDTGYSLSGGECVANCTIPDGTTGIVDGTQVEASNNSIDCNDTGYTGTLTYSCDGSFSLISNDCSNGPLFECSGGTLDTSMSGYNIHVFTSSGSLECTGSGPVDAQILVVGGGGGGGGVVGGGGGAGGVVYDDSYSLDATTYGITIGAGGSGGYGNGYGPGGVAEGGYAGQSSIFDTDNVTNKITAYGGGAGGANLVNSGFNTNGASGGGSSFGKTPGTAISGQGYAGGASSINNDDVGGGGGGAGGPGGDATSNVAGDGGLGVDYSSVFGTSYGDSGWFSSGGGGGVRDGSGVVYTPGNASQGGGTGGSTSSSVHPDDAADNTGGGGGGGAFTNWSGTYSINGGHGGSGIVMVKYSSGPRTSCTVSVTGVSTTSVSLDTSGVLNCDTDGYSDTVSYSCSAEGVISITGTCTEPAYSYYVLTSGSSFTVPSGYTSAKVWAIGGGGGGGGADATNNTYGDSIGGGGGAGGVAYKTWSVSSGDVISYSLGAAGSGGSGSSNGSAGGDTTVTFNSTTITGGGGAGGIFVNAGATGVTSGGTYSGGDGGSNGGGSASATSSSGTGRIGNGAPSGGAIGGVSGTHAGYAGAVGANSADISSLFTTLSSAGYSTTSGGAGTNTSPPTNEKHGGDATGFGCGGGGAGWYGGNGGDGLYGGGGGGASVYNSNIMTGGDGGTGVVVIQLN